MTTLLSEVFGSTDITVESFGNAGTAAAFLYGLAVEDVDSKLFAEQDIRYPLIVCGSAVKREPELAIR